MQQNKRIFSSFFEKNRSSTVLPKDIAVLFSEIIINVHNLLALYSQDELKTM